MENRDYCINSHKLIYHVSRVNHWLQGDDIYPIYLELGLSGNCNNRCIFCAFDFLKYKPAYLSLDCIKKFISEIAKLGIKSILYSGEGEPLLNKDIVDIVNFTKKSGIDVAISTNGFLLDRKKSEEMLKYLTWIRFSLDAATDKTYSLIHGTDKNDFNVVINNIKEAVEIKNSNMLSSTIGVQFLLIPQNYEELLPLVFILENIGVDYLVVKSYCSHSLSGAPNKLNLNTTQLVALKTKLFKHKRENFRIIFRDNVIDGVGKDKPYDTCLGLSFAAHIDARGDVYPCNAFIGRDRFILGNICEDSFKTIWKSNKREEVMDLIRDCKFKYCRDACRLDVINCYLWELKHPGTHVNFI